MFIVGAMRKETNIIEENEMLGKFNSQFLAESFSNRTVKMSAIILGDDSKFWVVNLANMSRLLKEGYELV